MLMMLLICWCHYADARCLICLMFAWCCYVDMLIWCALIMITLCRFSPLFRFLFFHYISHYLLLLFFFFIDYWFSETLIFLHFFAIFGFLSLFLSSLSPLFMLPFFHFFHFHFSLFAAFIFAHVDVTRRRHDAWWYDADADAAARAYAMPRHARRRDDMRDALLDATGAARATRKDDAARCRACRAFFAMPRVYAMPSIHCWYYHW